MSERPPTTELADRLALAIVEHGPTAGSQLALVVGARKAAVLAELRSNPTFEVSGQGRDTAWRLSSDVERFRARVDRSLHPSCWTWVGHITYQGYGAFKVRGRTIRAHRFAWELEYGPIPPARHVHHVCQNRACVNPQHLRVVAPGEHRALDLELDRARHRLQAWEPVPRPSGTASDHDTARATLDRLAALERRVAELERLLAPVAGQLTVDDALAMNGAEAAT